MAKRFNGDALYNAAQRLPNGGPRMSALMEAIRQADAAEDHYWRMLLRYDYACQAIFHDDPPKAMPAAAEFNRIFDEHSDALYAASQDGAPEMHLMITQIGIDPIVNLPQIPMEQWEDLMKEFRALVQKYHEGLRTYWSQMCQFWQYVDRDQAYTYFQKFWKTGRDGLSDCRACERSLAVRICLLAGKRNEADEYAKPMEQGRIWFCNDTPQRYWLAYLEDALDHREHERARVFANKLFRKADRDWNDLSYLGAIIHAWSKSGDDLGRALHLALKRLGWTAGMWDQKKLYDYYKGCYVCFRELAGKEPAIQPDPQTGEVIPKLFPLYNKEGVYDTRELAEWFYGQSQQIAAAFDKRNGSDYFSRDLALA
ncbi:MAG: hypothetical protein HFF90_06430 [Oscillibacter sp.]|nr:hypothetical protein [Oscillibacter sp.]